MVSVVAAVVQPMLRPMAIASQAPGLREGLAHASGAF
jgi:hypothetical protein